MLPDLQSNIPLVLRAAADAASGMVQPAHFDSKGSRRNLAFLDIRPGALANARCALTACQYPLQILG
jgi:hypothetical protein